MAKNNARSYCAWLYKQILTNLLFSLFRWDGLPEEIDPTIPERLLHRHGQCCFVQLPPDEDGARRWVCGTFTGTGPLDFNGNPLRVIVHGRNGTTLGEFAYTDIIPVYNNYIRAGDLQMLDDFSERLGILQNSIDTNVTMRRFPGLVVTPSKQLGSVKNLIEQFYGDKPLVVANTSMGEALSYINFGIPATAMDNDILKRRTWNECMVFMGIDASPAEKGAQVGASEVYASMGMTYQCRQAMEEPRRIACELAKKRGLNLSCTFVGQEAMESFAADKAPELLPQDGEEAEE